MIWFKKFCLKKQSLHRTCASCANYSKCCCKWWKHKQSFFAHLRTSLMENIWRGRPQWLVPHQKLQLMFLSLSHPFFSMYIALENKIPSNTVTPSIMCKIWCYVFGLKAQPFWEYKHELQLSCLALILTVILTVQLAQVKWLNFSLVCITVSTASGTRCLNLSLSHL